MADRAYLTEAMPMAVVWGRDDMVIPVRHASNAAALAPKARVEVIPNAGHFPHKDHPERFVKIVHDWIRTTQPGDVQPRQVAHAAASNGHHGPVNVGIAQQGRDHRVGAPSRCYLDLDRVSSRRSRPRSSVARLARPPSMRER